MKIDTTGFLIIFLGLIIILIYNIGPTGNMISRDYSDQNDLLHQKVTNIDSCFNSIDTSLHSPAIGCVNKFYAFIDHETLISLEFPGAESYIGCSDLIIDSSNNPNIQLLQYEKEKAHLQNRCTCFINIDAPKPIDTFDVISAQITIGGVPPPDTFWNDIPFKSILLKNARFKSETGKERHITNTLMWNVPDFGTAG